MSLIYTGSIPCMLQWLDKALDSNKRRYKGFTPHEIVQGLEKLAVIDSNKLKVSNYHHYSLMYFEKCHFAPHPTKRGVLDMTLNCIQW